MTAVVRIEFVQRDVSNRELPTRDTATIEKLLGSATVMSVTTTAASAACPSPPASREPVQTYARIIGISGNAIVRVGSGTPTVNQTNGNRNAAGQILYLPIAAGQKVAVVEAADTAV